MKRIGLFILIILKFATVYSETSKKDSLRAAITKAPTDSLHIEAMFEYMKATLNDNSSDFEPYIKEMIRLSKKTHNNWGLATAYVIGISYYRLNAKYEIALSYADSAEFLCKNDTAIKMMTNMGHVHLNRANLYSTIGDYQKAINDYLQAASIYKQLKHKSEAMAYDALSTSFEDIHNIPKAIEYSDKAIATAKLFDDKRLLANTMINKASKLMNWNNYRAADSILNIVKPIVLELNNIKSLALYYFNMGDVEAYYKKNIQKAIEYYNKSYDYANQTGYPDLILKPLQSILAVKIDRNEADTKSKLDLFYKLSKENDFMYETAVALDYYADWYFKQGNYKMAYDYARQYQSLSDSIVAEDTKEQTSLMEIRFRVANKEQEINKLKDEHKIQQLAIQHKNTLNYILVGGIIALLCILILSFHIYKSRQKIQQQRITELEKEKQLQATEAVLKGQEDERSRIAKDLHDGLGGLLSGVKYSLNNMKENVLLSAENATAFTRSIDLLDTGIQELRRIAHNMMPENLVKFGLVKALEDYCQSIAATDVLKINFSALQMENYTANINLDITIYRIIQELINNTIKHANATEIIVQLFKEDNKLNITVEDNGKGFDVKNINNFKGAGWTNIINRVNYLKGKTDVVSNEKEGTSVNIEIPLL